METTVIIDVSPNEGYSADQVKTSLTLDDLHEYVEDAILRYGGRAKIVLHNGQRYGAAYGKISCRFDEVFRLDGED